LRVKLRARRPDEQGVGGRSVIGFGGFVGMTVGGFVPELWGASSFGLSSFLFGIVGAVAGIWLGARLADA
jgi:uncharacterized membrane protein YeaQ/YmgE (transglycosylase-associated protein family)